MIKVENLRFAYDNGKVALDGINLEIADGEFLAVIGTNGSGKSTLAKHFNALLKPTAGKVYVDGLDTADEENLWRVRETVGMVFQNPDNEIVAAIVEDDVAFGPENLGIEPAEIRRRVDLALETVGMTGYRNFSPSKLSGGQKQRIAIAGAVAMRTRVIVFDEPTAMLDPQGRREVLATIKKLHAQGLTAISAERVAVMEAGRLLKIGTPREIFSDVAEMKRLGLDVPVAAELAARLKLPAGILTAGDLAAILKGK